MKLHMLYAVMATSLGMVSLAPTLQAEERPPLQQIAIWTANPESCERAALLELLKNKDVRVRSAALDLLESVTGKDFGLDPWVAPNKVPHEVQQALVDFLATAGYDPEFGARPVKRAIQRYLLNDLSKKLLSLEVDRNKPIRVERDTDGLKFTN